MIWASRHNLTTLTLTDLMSQQFLVIVMIQIKFPQDSSSEDTLSDHKAIRCLSSLQIHQRLTISAICRICHHFWWSLANRRGSSLSLSGDDDFMTLMRRHWGPALLCRPWIQGISHVSIVLPVEFCATHLNFGKNSNSLLDCSSSSYK